MRILTFTSLFPNPAMPDLGIAVVNRIRPFASEFDCHVDVIAPVPYGSRLLPNARWQALAEVPRTEQIDNIRVYHPRYLMLPKVGLPLQGTMMFLASYALAQRLHGQNHYDCIDAHYVYPDGFAAVLLARGLGLPVALTARGSDINLYATYRLIHRMIRFALRYADGLISVSSPLANALMRLGVPQSKIKVVGNGIDENTFFPLSRSAARSYLQLPEGAEVIVTVGGLNGVKGHEYLIGAVAQLAPSFPDLTLYCIGEGALRAQLEQLVVRLKVERRVKFIGLQTADQLRYWYGAANASCLASSREGCPNVVLESLACGTPVVATPVGGIPDLLCSPNVGLMVPRSVDGFSAGITKALTTEWDRECIAAYGRRRTWQSVAGEALEVLQAIAIDDRRGEALEVAR